MSDKIFLFLKCLLWSISAFGLLFGIAYVGANYPTILVILVVLAAAGILFAAQGGFD